MENHELAQILQAALPELTEVHVQSNDGSHFQVIAVSEQFATLSRIKQQQTIYAPLMDYIADNRIHAVSIKTYTPDQWQKDRKLYNI